MIVGQLIFSHDNPSNSRCCFYYTTKGDAAYAAPPFIVSRKAAHASDRANPFFIPLLAA